MVGCGRDVTGLAVVRSDALPTATRLPTLDMVPSPEMWVPVPVRRCVVWLECLLEERGVLGGPALGHLDPLQIGDCSRSGSQHRSSAEGEEG